MPRVLSVRGEGGLTKPQCTVLLEKLTDDAVAKLYVLEDLRWDWTRRRRMRGPGRRGQEDKDEEDARTRMRRMRGHG